MTDMHELVQSVQDQVKSTATPLRQVARAADVNYWWLVKFKLGESSGMSSKGLRYVEKLQRFFSEAM
jgi:hypothetical protein